MKTAKLWFVSVSYNTIWSELIALP